MRGAAFGLPSPVAVLVRPSSCSGCGADALRWAQLVDLLEPVAHELHTVRLVAAALGPDVEGWRCRACGLFVSVG